MSFNRFLWDKRLANNTSPSLLTLSPPGTFIYRIISSGFDGNSNFQACYTHRTAGNVDLSAWAADNDGTILTELSSCATRDVQTNSTDIIYTSYSSDPGQQIKIVNYDGYFIFEATHDVPSSSGTNFNTVSTSTFSLGLGYPYESETDLSFDNTNFPFPTPLDLDVTVENVLIKEIPVDFDIILNSDGRDTTGRPDDGMLYPRGFQTIGAGGLIPPAPDPDPDPDPTPDTLPAGSQYSFIESNQSANLSAGNAQTFVIDDRRYLNYFQTSGNGTAPPAADGNVKPWYIYYLDNSSTLQTITLPVTSSLNGDTFIQIYWAVTGPDPQSVIGNDNTFVISDTNLLPS